MADSNLKSAQNKMVVHEYMVKKNGHASTFNIGAYVINVRK
jgi:hypothetical protein